MSVIHHIQGHTFHGRKGAVENVFRYGVDYVLLDPETGEGPSLFARNGRGLASLHDIDHGGAPKQGAGVAWVREILDERGIVCVDRIELLAQPRLFGHVFNPVSFWLCWGGDDLRVVIPEVSNTYGDRHSYLCHHDDLRPIQPTDTLTARKLLHVSPFQPIGGDYKFRFDFTGDKVGVWIDFSHGNHGLYATLTGRRAPLTNRSLLGACLRRPFGSRRVLGLIHWQALKLWFKGARFRARPLPPTQEVSK